MTGGCGGLPTLPTAARARLSGSVAVLSPHLDDAVLSLGAALHAYTRDGGRAQVVTVFAGDPTSDADAGSWDRAAGFFSQGTATSHRRREDMAACRRLAVAPVHLDEVDEQYPRRTSDEELWRAVVAVVEGWDELLLPGHPLIHADHQAVTRSVLRHLHPDRPVRLYEEQPYAMRHEGKGLDQWSGAARWGALATSRRDAAAKIRAAACYSSQLPLLGPGRLSSPSRVGVPVTLTQLWRAVRARGERVTAPVPASVLTQGWRR